MTNIRFDKESQHFITIPDGDRPTDAQIQEYINDLEMAHKPNKISIKKTRLKAKLISSFSKAILIKDMNEFLANHDNIVNIYFAELSDDILCLILYRTMEGDDNE